MLIRPQQLPTTESPLMRAAIIHEPGDTHWQGGADTVSSERPVCTDAKAFPVGCTIDYGVNGKPTPFEDEEAFTDFYTFNIVHSAKCSILAHQSWKNVRTYAENALRIKERKALEAILWGAANTPLDIDGAFTSTTPAQNATVIASGTDFCGIDAVTALENVIYDVSDVVYIHVPRALINYLVPYLHKDDAGNFRTALGSFVIPGTGYDGAAPGGTPDATGDSAFIYGTGQVQLLRGELLVFPEEDGHAFDMPKNTAEFIAERAWGVHYDPCVGVYGVSALFCHTT